MDIKNNAHASGTVTLKVELSQRIDAKDWRDDSLFLDWLVEHIREYNYTNIEIVSEDINLSDFTFIPED